MHVQENIALSRHRYMSFGGFGWSHFGWKAVRHLQSFGFLEKDISRRLSKVMLTICLLLIKATPTYLQWHTASQTLLKGSLSYTEQSDSSRNMILPIYHPQRAVSDQLRSRKLRNAHDVADRGKLPYQA